MPPALRAPLMRLVDAIREFTVAQRTIAIIGVAVVVLGGIALGSFLLKPNYVPLFTGLSSTDASGIVTQLDADKVPYQLSDGGATIMVPADKVDQERLNAAAKGFPSLETGGYALLDKLGVTSSEFQQTVTYKRALEGELAHTIESIDGVNTAVVQLAVPEKSVFDSQTVAPTASVFVDIASGGSLSAQQVQAITHLTAASVDGLTPENVSLVDQKGTVLSAIGSGTVGDAGQQQSDYESRVQQSVQAMLDRVVGPGNATVAIAADVSQQSAQQVSTTYSQPTNAPATSQSTTKETYTGTGAGAAAGSGVLGDTQTTTSGTTTSGIGDSYTTTSDTRDNALNTTKETRTIPAGAVTRQTISVAVNSTAVTGVSQQQISTMVATAAGVNAARGDLVTVTMAPWATTGATTATQALADGRSAEDQARLTSLIQTGVIAGSVLLGFIALIVVIARARRRSEVIDGVIDGDDDGNRALGFLDDADRAEMPPVAAPRYPEPSILEPQGFESMKADLENMAANDPRRTAEYLRQLMEDRRA